MKTLTGYLFSWCILPFPFFARGHYEKIGLPASHFFSVTWIDAVNFKVSINSLYFSFVRTCWKVKQPVFGYALACLIEWHTVVFRTHPGGARYRVILPQFRVSYLLSPRRKGVQLSCFLQPDMYSLFFMRNQKRNLFTVACNSIKFEFMPKLNVISFYTVK